MRVSVTIVAVLLALQLGCGSFGKNKEEGDGLHGVSSKQADAMGAERSVFEKSDDPPFNAGTRFAAGRLAEAQGAIPQAITQYNEALKLDPNYAQAWYQLGVLYAKTKQFPKAIDAWEHYVKVTNDSAAAYSNLGFCYEVSGDRPSAESAYLKGIERDPKNVPCRVNYGLMLARAGNEPGALQQLQAVLTPAEAHYNLGSAYEQLNRIPEARVQYQKALEINPKFWEAQTRLAQLK